MSVGIWPICECVIARSDSTSEMEDAASERQTCRHRRAKKQEVEIGHACRCLAAARASLDQSARGRLRACHRESVGDRGDFAREQFVRTRRVLGARGYLRNHRLPRNQSIFSRFNC